MSLTPHKQPVDTQTWTVFTSPRRDRLTVDVHEYGPPPRKFQAVMGDKTSEYYDDAMSTIIMLMMDCGISVDEIISPEVNVHPSDSLVREEVLVRVPPRRCIILFEAPSCLHWAAWRGQSSWRAGCKEIQMEVEGATFADLQVAANLRMQNYFRERMKSQDPSFSWRALGLHPIGGPIYQKGTESWDDAEFDIPFTMIPVT